MTMTPDAPMEPEGTTIKASCPNCGEVSLTVTDITMVVCNDPDLSWYGFDCTGCAEYIRKPMPLDHQQKLMQVIKPVMWDVGINGEKPINHDDILDFWLEAKKTNRFTQHLES